LSVSTAMRPELAAWTRSRQMPRYLISFDAHAMDHIPDDDMPAVAKASHEVVEEALNAGVWVFGGGLENQKASVVATDGTVTDGRYGNRRVLCRRRALTRGGAGVGCQDRRRLPLCSRGPRVHARPSRRQLEPSAGRAGVRC
jgi:hypothetical protein